MNHWVEVSEQRLAANFRAMAESAGAQTEVLAVVKANAYGHGAELCAPVLARAGARWLGVTSADEGARVRQALRAAQLKDGPAQQTSAVRGPDVDILVMCGSLPEDVPALVAYRLTPVVWTMEHVAWLQADAPLGLRLHVEVDTGMGRQGVRPGAELDALLQLIEAAGLILDGLFTHFSSSEVAGSLVTLQQQRRFTAAVGQLRGRSLRPAWIHAGNTSTVDNPAEPSTWLADLAASVGARPMVRSGLGLYGYCLPVEREAHKLGNSHLRPDSHVQPALKPVMTWKARILAVHDLAAGETVGYGATFTATAAMRVALLPVGYADGLRRELSSTNDRPGGWVIIAGTRAPILGRVSMNLTVVDITPIARPVAAGDEAIVLGAGITAEDHARIAGTIAYEILCGVRADSQAS